MAEHHREAAAFIVAAHWVAGLVQALPDTAWHGPGLGEWGMRALVGHTSRALLTVEQSLDTPVERADIDSAEDYYETVARAKIADAGMVLRRGVEAGEALGADPAAEFGAIAERVVALTADSPDQLVTCIAGGILLSDFLPTRTFELVVHGLDIARAAGLPTDPPEVPLRRALDLAASLALRSGEGPRMLLALTGREELGRGFSVLG